MPKKIRRRGPSVFHKRKTKIIKNICVTLAALSLIPLGFFTGKYMMENIQSSSSPSSESTVSQQGQSSSGSSETSNPQTETTAPPTSQPTTANGTLRAFYLPFSQLTLGASLDSKLDQASAAGYNAVVFDVKDDQGWIHYQSATPFVAQAETVAETALSAEQFRECIQRIQEKGILPIPRVFAFKDHQAPFNLASAKITLQDSPGYTWLDNSRDKGGKPWLNPYSPDAHSYIIELVKELKGFGLKAVILDGVQFPNQTSSAYYGKSELTSLSQPEVLQRFVSTASTAVGSDMRVIQAMPGLAAFGDGTAPFGGNPVTFGAATVAPMLMPSTLGNRITTAETTLTDPASNPQEAVKLAAGQVKLRLELMPKDARPQVMPWVQAYSYSDEQIKQQISSVTESLGADASFIIYNEKGEYNFSAIRP